MSFLLGILIGLWILSLSWGLGIARRIAVLEKWVDLAESEKCTSSKISAPSE